MKRKYFNELIKLDPDKFSYEACTDFLHFILFKDGFHIYIDVYYDDEFITCCIWKNKKCIICTDLKYNSMIRQIKDVIE